MLMECETALVDPVIAARRIVEAIGQPIATPGRSVQVSCSVGLATYPEHGPRERLVAHADAAMCEAKRAGGNTWAHFEERLEGPRPEMLGLQNDLRFAIEHQQLELYYQPKVDGRTGETHGVEALLRWKHPEHGMVSPGVFIPLAERYGLICKLGDWVIDDACRQVEQWQAEGVRMNVAINLSVHQLREKDHVERIEQALLRHDIDADQLLCEITESVAMGDVKATQAAFSGLAHIGVLLSIDDFGTGFTSSLSRAAHGCRLDELKVDQQLRHALWTTSPADAARDRPARWSELGAPSWASTWWPRAWRRPASATCSQDWIATSCRGICSRGRCRRARCCRGSRRGRRRRPPRPAWSRARRRRWTERRRLVILRAVAGSTRTKVHRA